MVNEENKAEATVENVEAATATENTEESAEPKKKKCKSSDAEIKKLQKELDTAKADLADMNDKYVRMLAEYDNFRRRSQKERETIYADAYIDAVSEILPIIDNLELATKYGDAEAVAKGVQMILKSSGDIFEKLGIKEIDSKTFDPNFHNGVMHIEDDNYGEEEIVDVFMKGYKIGDKIIRPATVKVAN